MAPLRILRHVFLIIIILGVCACEKGSISNEKSFISIVDTETDYITRNCFQLNDGSYIIVGTGPEYAIMAKYSESGDFIWKKRLPGTIFGLKKGIPLPSGGFILAGTDSTLNFAGVNQSGKATLIALDNDGNITNSATFSSTPIPLMVIQLDLILLGSGNLALGLCPQPPQTNSTYPRLLLLDQSLSVLFDQVYYASPGISFPYLSSPRMQEGENGSIYFCFQSGSGGSLLKLNSDYSMSFYTDNPGLSASELPGSMAIDKQGNICMATARQVNPGQSGSLFYHVNEYWSFGSQVSVIRTDTSGAFIDRHDYNGFPPNGSLMKIIRSGDGGFIMVGTSNQSESFSFVSNTNIFIIKTDSDLKQQWTRQYRTTYPSVGYDIIETRDGGYAIGAFERTFNKNFKMMIIKVDELGN